MKRSILALTAAAALALAGTAIAMPGMGPGAGAGPGAGRGAGMAAQGQYTEQHKKFIAGTLPIREEMHKKHIELQKEWIKDKPDTAKITKLQGEMTELRKKMMDARAKSGLPMGKMAKKGGKGKCGSAMNGCGMGMMPMDCPKMAPAAAAPAGAPAAAPHH